MWGRRGSVDDPLNFYPKFAPVRRKIYRPIDICPQDRPVLKGAGNALGKFRGYFPRAQREQNYSGVEMRKPFVGVDRGVPASR